MHFDGSSSSHPRSSAPSTVRYIFLDTLRYPFKFPHRLCQSKHNIHSEASNASLVYSLVFLPQEDRRRAVTRLLSPRSVRDFPLFVPHLDPSSDLKSSDRTPDPPRFLRLGLTPHISPQRTSPHTYPTPPQGPHPTDPAPAPRGPPAPRTGGDRCGERPSSTRSAPPGLPHTVLHPPGPTPPPPAPSSPPGLVLPRPGSPPHPVLHPASAGAAAAPM